MNEKVTSITTKTRTTNKVKLNYAVENSFDQSSNILLEVGPSIIDRMKGVKYKKTVPIDDRDDYQSANYQNDPSSQGENDRSDFYQHFSDHLCLTTEKVGITSLILPTTVISNITTSTKHITNTRKTIKKTTIGPVAERVRTGRRVSSLKTLRTTTQHQTVIRPMSKTIRKKTK